MQIAFALVVLLLISPIESLRFNVSSLYDLTDEHKHYVVYMGSHSLKDSETVIQSNHMMLSSYVGSVGVAKRKTVHHYHKSFRGFSAMLTPKQARDLRKNKKVVSVFESTKYTLQTTRSWSFLTEHSKGQYAGLFDRVSSANKSADVIIGHFDSGIWPEAPCFNPSGFDYVPNYFRGECMEGDAFTRDNCNGKIVGARYYSQGYEYSFGPLENYGQPFFRSPRDDNGHGTHTASTAAGNIIADIDAYGTRGLAARGGAINARLSVYKTCWFDACDGSDVLKAFDDAIHDNVDIITISLGTQSPESYFKDPFSVGAFHAFKRGILVVSAAGNYGTFGRATTVNIAPWVVTVAASSIDRELFSSVQLGNGDIIKGYAANVVGHDEMLPLIWAGEAADRESPIDQANQCMSHISYSRALMRGKIVVCATVEGQEDRRLEKINLVAEMGGAGVILIHTGLMANMVFIKSIPTCTIGDENIHILQRYMDNTTAGSRTARISAAKAEMRTTPAPMIIPISGQGPNVMTPDIIKPDLSAPGLNIIAAYPVPFNQRADEAYYHLDTGTSMATPHVAGVAAVIKAFNKGWSPGAIKSALMTTASSLDNTGKPIRAGANLATPYDFGSGELNPDRALSPGLVYDLGLGQAIHFLCSLTNDENLLYNVVGDFVRCVNPPAPAYYLNYPSISITNLNRLVSVPRTLTLAETNPANPVYKSEVHYAKSGIVDVRVDPPELDFSREWKQTFYVTFTPLAAGAVWGDLTWSNDDKIVKTPFVINVLPRYY